MFSTVVLASTFFLPKTEITWFFVHFPFMTGDIAVLPVVAGGAVQSELGRSTVLNMVQ